MSWLESAAEDDRRFHRAQTWQQNLRDGTLDFDILPPFREWPLWAKNDATLSSRKPNEHLDNTRRFKLWHFFVRNGVEPHLAAGTVAAVSSTDFAARSQLRWLAANSERVLEKYKDARVYDCLKRKPVNLAGE